MASAKTNSRPARKRPKQAKESLQDPGRAVRVRMYRHGLGDCFLLSFPDKSNKFCHVLIDCGLITVAPNPKPTMEAVAKDIKEATDNHLNLVIVTHEHWDHVSGFSSQQAQAIFKSIPVDEVWYAWTEDPGNKLGKKLRKDRELKALAVSKAAVALRSVNPERSRQLGAILGFVGVDNTESGLLAAAKDGAPGKTRQAFEFMGTQKKPRYCYPDDDPRPLKSASNVLAYVLGPPQDESLIKRRNPTAKGKEGYGIASSQLRDQHLLAALSRRESPSLDEQDLTDLPFDPYVKRIPGQSPSLDALIQETWNRSGDEWRKIEHDWLASVETLAIDLDNYTNNTCLVVAFELMDSGRVMLFAADAQVGNWLSWQDLKWELEYEGKKRTVTGPDLLARTVLYKVGHHGSHNATLREKGLEQMVSPELTALIPVNKAQAEKNRWHDMPFEKLINRLEEKTDGRIVVSDGSRSLSQKEKDALGAQVKEDSGKLFYDVFVKY